MSDSESASDDETAPGPDGDAPPARVTFDADGTGSPWPERRRTQYVLAGLGVLLLVPVVLALGEVIEVGGAVVVGLSAVASWILIYALLGWAGDWVDEGDGQRGDGAAEEDGEADAAGPQQGESDEDAAADATGDHEDDTGEGDDRDGPGDAEASTR